MKTDSDLRTKAVSLAIEFNAKSTYSIDDIMENAKTIYNFLKENRT